MPFHQYRRSEDPNERRIRLACLENPEVISASRLTEDQKVALLRHWNIYKQTYKSAKVSVSLSGQKIEQGIAKASEGAVDFEPIGSMHNAAEGHVAINEAATMLHEFNEEELRARMELMSGIWAVLTPIQHAYVMMKALPQPDIVGMYKAMLQMEE